MHAASCIPSHSFDPAGLSSSRYAAKLLPFAHAPARASADCLFRPAVTEPAHTTADDTQLVTAMARGDERAAARLYDRHAAMVYGLALRITGERADAEDVVVEAFAQAWRDAARFDGVRGSVTGWLVTITRSRALDQMRARRRRQGTADQALQQDTPVAMGEGFRDAARLVEDTECAAAVAQALGELPPAQRTVIELAFFEGLTHPEVAARLREPLGTVKTRIRLGLLKLRDRLQGLAPGAS
jgi:RNA polymerase sigma-70 factor (ECF subfamily)